MGCDHFVYASSSSVYGESRQEVFREDDVVETPVSPYAATKKMCELTAHTYSHLYGLPVTGLRFFTVYGPRGRPDMAPFKFVDRVMRDVEIQQFGDGTSSRDYTYIDDIVDGVIRALDRPAGYQIYNLGNGNPIELRRFIAIVEQCCGKVSSSKKRSVGLLACPSILSDCWKDGWTDRSIDRQTTTHFFLSRSFVCSHLPNHSSS